MLHPTPNAKRILILSDGTGGTAQQMVDAALKQFEHHGLHVSPPRRVGQPDELRAAMDIAGELGACVVTTFASEDLRALAPQLAAERNLPHIDLMDDLLTLVSDVLERDPAGVPGLLHRADDDYFRRIAAVEFTLNADDGQQAATLPEADVVLVGVSRTGKTPLSSYLAHKGKKVGNVPVVLDQPPPEELDLVDENRIFGLTIDAGALHAIRRVRARSLGLQPHANYDDMDYILAELDYAHSLFRSHRQWPVIDVTGKAVEETAMGILSILTERGLHSPR